MDIYKINLTGLLGLCAALWVAQARGKPKDEKKAAGKTTAHSSGGGGGSQWAFLTVYALVMAADWLQVGPPFFSFR